MVELSTFAAIFNLETPFDSLVGVMVTPLPASKFTLSPGLTKPTLEPFACNCQPLLLIASATLIEVTNQSAGAVFVVL